MTCDSKINFFNLLLPHLTGFQRVLTNRLNVTIMIIACFNCFTFSWYKSLVFWNHEPNNRYLQLQIIMSMCYTYHMSFACCCNEQFGWICYSMHTVRSRSTSVFCALLYIRKRVQRDYTKYIPSLQKRL
jgi:hypothetical protein